MPDGLLELGEAMLAASTQRLEAVAQNVANSATPGYKAQLSFEQTLADAAGAAHRTPNLAQGTLQRTGAPLDLALAGPGFFALRDGETITYTRSAQFERDANGRVVDAAGRVLQAVGGGDIVVSRADPEILSDGVILEDGLPQAAIAVFDIDDANSLQSIGGAHFSAPDGAMAAIEANVRQGMLESSNVDTAHEVLQMMTAIRQAETGARVVQTYDALISQSITTLGRSAR